jgi:mRNA interferase MazF
MPWTQRCRPRQRPGFQRPVVVVQSDAFNRSRIATIVCILLTSNLRWTQAPGNTMLPARTSGLPKDSVANVSQILALDRDLLTERAGRFSRNHLETIFDGIGTLLGR